jgi:hypothetical protein
MTMGETLVKVPVIIGTVPFWQQVQDLEEGTEPLFQGTNLCKKTIMHNVS